MWVHVFGVYLYHMSIYLSLKKDAWNGVPISRYWKVGVDGALRGVVVVV